MISITQKAAMYVTPFKVTPNPSFFSFATQYSLDTLCSFLWTVGTYTWTILQAQGPKRLILLLREETHRSQTANFLIRAQMHPTNHLMKIRCGPIIFCSIECTLVNMAQWSLHSLTASDFSSAF